MIPLDRELTDHEVSEVFSLIRRATRSATTALSRAAGCDARPGVEAIYEQAGLERLSPDLFRASGWDTSGPPIYLTHNTADNDAAIVRPLGWRDPSQNGEALRELLFGISRLPTGGYALARLEDRDLIVFIDHLATQRLDPSEVETSLMSARFAGAMRGVDTEPSDEACPGTSSEVKDAIDGFLLDRPTGWARPKRDESSNPGWIHAGDAPIAAYLDEERALLVMARGLRSFLGNLQLDVTERLLRTNLGLLDGAITALRDGAQGAIVILQRLCCQDLDTVELERSVSYLERVKVAWTRESRPALELLGILERNRAPLRRSRAESTPVPVDRSPRWPEEVQLGALESGDELRLPISDLLTHVFVCGGSGSGKTVACKGLLEELALAGVPSIVVDLKGDLSSLPCVPDSANAQGIAKYLLRLYGDSASSHATEIADVSRRVADLYEEAGLHDEALREFRSKVQYRVLTPRSDFGIPLSLSPLGKIELGSIGETTGIIGNRNLHELVDSNLRSLVEHLDLSGGDTETLVAVLTQLLEGAHRKGLPLQGVEGVETLVRLLFEVGEHAEKINFLPTEWAIESREAQRYARAMNARLGGTFRYWFDGETLAIDDLITQSDGRVPINIVNLSMLPNTSDQAYAIAQINGYIIEWMRRQPGAQRPRLAYFIDEIAQDGGKGAIFPPYPRNPITKPGLTVLLKQGRAFGVSCILATQNAKDIDYKGLGQIDTWIVGRLKTAVDLDRLKLGIEAAQAEATHCFDDRADDMLSRVAGLSPGSFVVKTRTAGVLTYRQRWIRSLHERMTPEMVRQWSRAEELAVDRQVEQAQERWNQGDADRAIEVLEELIALQPYYTRLAETRLLLCEWLFRTEDWSRVAEYASALRETVRSRANFELVHYYEGLSHLHLNDLDRAREALERFVSSAAGSSSTLGERCRQHLEDLFVAQDDYDRLEEAAQVHGSSRASQLIAFCRTMKSALARWPTLRGRLDGATVLDDPRPDAPERIEFAQKGGRGARTVHAYAAEIQRRLGDLDLSAPEVTPFTGEEAERLREIRSRIQLDETERRSREDYLGEILAEAERLVAESDFAGASAQIDDARKVVRSCGLPSDGLERVISLYRGAVSVGQRSIRDWFLGLEPHRFELEVAALFRSLGYRAHATKASGDGGVDVWAEYQNRRHVIQCKRYRHPIAPGAIRELATTMQNFDADEGIFVTTSRFTDGCRDEADRHGIRLIDLEGLLRLYATQSSRPARRSESQARRPGQRKRARITSSSISEGKLREHVMVCLAGADEPLPIGEIAERTRFSEGDCREALVELIEEGVVLKSGRTRGTRYQLAEDE